MDTFSISSCLKDSILCRIFLPRSKTSSICYFFLGLYLISLGTGGIKPCVSSFGADQFDDTDPAGKVKKESFFNWFYFCINIGALIASTSLVWLQENYEWALAFGIPTLLMGLAIISFFTGTSFFIDFKNQVEVLLQEHARCL